MTRALPLLVVVVLVGGVQALHALGRLPVFLPAPSELWAAADPRVLAAHIGPTLGRAAAGFAIAAGLALGAAGLATAVAALFGPIYTLGATLQAIPVIALTPLLAVWLGTGPSTQVVIAVLAAQFPMLAGAMQGFRAVDARQMELFHTLAAPPWQRLRLLIVPASLPYVFQGFKVAAPSAVLGTITAEWAGAERGVGAMMLNALFAFDPPQVWLAVLSACVLAGGGYALWAAVERLVVVWDRPAELAP